MQAIIALLLSNIPTLIAAGKEGYSLVMAIRAEAQRTGEWTPEQEVEFQARLELQNIDPAWQTDEELNG